MPDYGIDPFGKLMQTQMAIDADRFKRQQYDDLMQRQRQQDELAAQDRMMKQQAGAAIPNLMAQQQADAYGPLQEQIPVDNQRAIQDALIANADNPYMLQVAGQYDKFLNPQAGGGLSRFTGIGREGTPTAGKQTTYTMSPTGEIKDTGIAPAQKTSTGGMSQEDARVFAQSIIKGNLDINTIPKRGSVRQEILKEVYKLKPDFDVVEAEANARYTKDLSNLRSVGLIAGVEPLFDNLIAMGNKLDNTGVPIWNKIKNKALEATGDPDIVAFNNARDDFVAEAERILMGSGVLSDSKYNRALQNLNSAQSPKQMMAAIEQIRKVVEARDEALKESPYTPQLKQPQQAPPPEAQLNLVEAARAELARRRGQ